MSRSSKNCLERILKGRLAKRRANLEEAVAIVLDANREQSEQSLDGAQVIREVLVLPAA